MSDSATGSAMPFQSESDSKTVSGSKFEIDWLSGTGWVIAFACEFESVSDLESATDYRSVFASESAKLFGSAFDWEFASGSEK